MLAGSCALGSSRLTGGGDSDWFEDQIPVQEFDRLYLSTNTEPFYLPVNKHREKLAAIAAAANTDEEEVTA